MSHSARSTKLLATALVSATMLSGCAQIGSVADTLWGGTKSAAKFVYSPVKSLLRDAPEQDVQYVEANPYGTVDYGVSPYAGAQVELYDAPASTVDQSYASTSYVAPTYGAGFLNDTFIQPDYTGGKYYAQAETAPQVAATAAADSLSFVRLNGESSMNDWQFCETVNRGYWKIDAAGGRINPDFEVCMRNKGYVLESELSTYGFNGETPVTAPQRAYTDGYVSFP